MTRIDGYVSKKTIRLWLENYESLAVGDRFPDAPPSFTGPSAQDGKSDGRLNKIVLDQAIKQLPKNIKYIVLARYVYKIPRKNTLRIMNITAKLYYSRCRQAVDLLHMSINGDMAGMRRLIKNLYEA
jgi:fimbrial chaperone protein